MKSFINTTSFDVLACARFAQMLAAALLAALASCSGGCATVGVLDASSGGSDYRPVSMRVEKCFLGPDGKLVALGYGGEWRQEVSDTPHAQVHFGVNIPASAKDSKDGVVTLPQDALKTGWPSDATLAKLGYTEVPFREYEFDKPAPLSGEPLTPETPWVRVSYYDLRKSKNFPELLGYWPRFTVEGLTGVPAIPVELVGHTYNTRNEILVMLPAAAAVDVVSIAAVASLIALPFAGIDAGNGIAPVSYQLLDPHTPGGAWQFH